MRLMRDVSLNLGWVIVAGVIAASSFPLIALPAATTTPSGTQPGVAASGSTQASAAPTADGDTTVDLKPVPSELQGKLDAKSAKVGDSVVVKTKAAVKIGDGTEIPKGTKLIGHVTDVQAHAGNGESRVAIEFDHAEVKGGQSLPIRSVIESLQPPLDMAGGGGMPVQGGSGSTGGRGSIGRSTSTTPGEPAAGQRTTVADATSQEGSSVHQVPGYADGVTARGTGVDGVSLASEATGATLQSASGILFSAKKNVHLNDGTQIVLAVTSGATK